MILRKHYEEIVNHVSPEQLLIQLITHNLVTQEEQYMLLNQNFSPQKRTQLLLVQLSSKNPNNCVQLFCQCLRAETQHTGHQYLADLLERDIREHESQSKVAANRGASDPNTVVLTESEIDSLLPTLTSYWTQIAEILSAPQEMVTNITTSSQDPEQQARMFLQQYTLYARKENIYQALDQLGITT